MTRLARPVAIAALWCCVVGVVALHVLRTDLPPVSHRLSEYANGPYGWIMTAVFVALGLALVALGVVLWSDPSRGTVARTVPVAAFVAGVGALVSGLFRTGISGTSEALHSRASGLATVAIVVMAAVSAWPSVRRGDASRDRVAVGLAAAAVVLALLSPLLHETRWTGLSQRLLWAVLLAWLLWTASRCTPRPSRTERVLAA